MLVNSRGVDLAISKVLLQVTLTVAVVQVASEAVAVVQVASEAVAEASEAEEGQENNVSME